MSFLTAILGGLGGYAAGKNQRQQFDYQKQQDTQAEADRQKQLAIQQATWQETARQQLVNRGTNPATATWDPTTMSYTGGKPFDMPKGWQVVPNDPQQAMGHYQRLMNWLAGQNRAQSDTGVTAQLGYQTAAQQVAAQQRFGQELYLKKAEFQHTDWLEGIKAKYAQQGREYEAGQSLYREGLNEAHSTALNEANHNFELAKAKSPTLQMIYGGMTKLPDSALNAARAARPKIEASITTAIGNLDKTNMNFQGKYITGPNPGMTDFTRVMNFATAQLEKDPSKLQNYLNQAKAGNDAFRNTGKGFTDAQHDLMVNYLSQVANNEIALRSAQHAVQIVNTQFGIPNVPFMPGQSGGSQAPPNPRYPHP